MNNKFYWWLFLYDSLVVFVSILIGLGLMSFLRLVTVLPMSLLANILFAGKFTVIFIALRLLLDLFQIVQIRFFGEDE